jgi:hypothetical protein
MSRPSAWISPLAADDDQRILSCSQRLIRGHTLAVARDPDDQRASLVLTHDVAQA